MKKEIKLFLSLLKKNFTKRGLPANKIQVGKNEEEIYIESGKGQRIQVSSDLLEHLNK